MSGGKLMVGNNKPKLYCGDHKVSRVYVGDTKIYSSGNVVTYMVNGKAFAQDYEAGQDVLHPTVVNPSLSGAEFLGWSMSAGDATVVGSLVMADEPLNLYAVFKHADLTITSNGYSGNGNEGEETKVNGVIMVDNVRPMYGGSTQYIDCTKYSACTFSGLNGYVGTDHNGDRIRLMFKIGSNAVELAYAVHPWDDSGLVTASFSGTRTMDLDPADGDSPLTVRAEINPGYYGGYSYLYTTNGFSIAVTGRTVIG